eukprot:jgi/Orpsp1_1/1175786/evm.model.c7180000055195.2
MLPYMNNKDDHHRRCATGILPHQQPRWLPPPESLHLWKEFETPEPAGKY